MNILHVLIFCCGSVVWEEATAVLEVNGHVGGEVSIHCSGRWSTNISSQHYNMYFCKGTCSKENTLIQTERKMQAVAQHGRYSMEVNREDGDFNVTIKRLNSTDTGKYHCGVGKRVTVLYQEINLIVLDASSVPPGAPPSTTTARSVVQTETLLPGSSASLPAEKTDQKTTAKFTDTTVVIIVSVSLALLVCAIIPLIFYGHCRTNSEGQNRPEASKGEPGFYEENDCVTSTLDAVRLQSSGMNADAESSLPEDPQYAAVYQALDPKNLD